MYAQTIAYGLLAARVSRPVGIVADNLADMVPITNPFLKEMLGTFLTVGGRKGKIDFDELGIQEVVDLLNSPDTNVEAVLRDFGKRTMQEDPVVHFYELFLKEYDKKKKVERGVFYTPQPVVSYIVRSVHELLKSEFGLEDGLASTVTWGAMVKRNSEIKIPEGVASDEPFVLILDIATGTATFLVEVIEVIYNTLLVKWKKERHLELEMTKLWNEYVPKHLLPRLYGFELMMAPYAIAHMKIGLKLAETGYRFGSDERAHIYLTNSLEPPSDSAEQPQFEDMAPALAHEAKAVNAIKRRKRFTVLMGNPPYSNYGMLNKIPWILALLDDYKSGLNEKKINLDDDFIKFIRFAQYHIEQSLSGIVGMVTNNVYIDGLTHRRMRESLIKCFEELRILDLHGNASALEKTETGTKDDNVFDIKQGVSICIFKKKPSSAVTVQFSDLKGVREQKYASLSGSNCAFKKLNPTEPYYFLVPKEFGLQDEYFTGLSLTDIFEAPSYGIQTKRDSLTIAMDKNELDKHVEDTLALNNEELKKAYDLPDDGRDWHVDWARDDLRRLDNPQKYFQQILYRPFDKRWTVYTDASKGFLAYPRWHTMRHMTRRNLGLVAMRQVFQHMAVYSHFCVTDTLIDERTFYSNRGGTYLFPLFIYPSATDALLSSPHDQRHPNFKRGFSAYVENCLGMSLCNTQDNKTIRAETFFYYLYAVFHSPTYRTRYAEFLKIDYPRLPLTTSLRLFHELAELGGDLVTIHLMESPSLDRHIARFTGKGIPQVEKGSYSDETVWIDKAKSLGFQGVSEKVWNFYIGGYQVCEKWLKDRKGRTLSPDDINHYHRIVVALSETIRIMAEIDKVIEAHGGWPGAFQVKKDDA